MSQLVQRQNPDTGETEYGIYDPTTGLQPISKEDADQFRKSRVERFFGSLGDTLQDSVGFLVDQLDPTSSIQQYGLLGFNEPEDPMRPGLSVGERIMAQNDPRQTARAQADPSMSTLGAVAGFGLEAAFPGAPLARGATQTLRQTTARTVGQRLGLDAGQTALDVSDARRAALNAATNPNPAQTGGERVLRGFLEPGELDELSKDFSAGRLYTPGDARALTARTADEIGAADELRQFEELSRSDILGDRALGRGRSINKIRDEAESVASQVVLRELGENQATRLTSSNMNRLRREIGGKFDEAAKEAGDFRFTNNDLDRIQEAVDGASADDLGVVERIVRNMADDMPNWQNTVSGGDSAVMSNEVARQYRTRLGKQITDAAQAGRFERAQTLGEIQDVLDDIVERQISGETASTLNEARKQYRVFKALERSTATTNAGGEVNIRSFMNAYQARGNRFGKSSGRSGEGDKFYRTMETLRYLTERVEPSSGTAQRVIANVGRGAAAAGLAGAAGVAGGLLGN